MRKIILCLTVLFSLSLTLFSQTEKQINKSELLNGVKIEQEKITFIVFNSGYTGKSSFKLNITKNKEGYEIELIRINRDSGKMVPEPIEIIFTKDELGNKIDLRKNIKIKNNYSSLGIF